ncbi:uncharacterized protein [Palaemon carinicauda]|uniref:uncharacterized protein isoform X2 n=1 Tax=Palaemon carinicauda TaxID=392227 RepID=UPI0035B5F797
MRSDLATTMWRSSHGFHRSLCLDLASVTLVLAVQLCATEGSSSVAAGYEGDCTVYHLKDGDAQSSSTPTISIEESLRIYLFSDSLQWSGFSIGFTDWLDKTTGMLTYHENVEDDGGFFTLTGIEERRRGEDSSRKYKDEVVKIPREVYSLQTHVWINFTVVVQKNKLKVVFTDSAIVHFTFDASNYKKAFVHMDQSHAISVTFNCMEDTGDHHSSSKIGLTIGLTLLIIITLLIITVLSVAAFYIMKRRRNGQQKLPLEKEQGKDIENSKSSAQNDPMEKESLLQKAEDKKEVIYNTENETKSDEAIPNRISEVAGDFEATKYNNFCLEENYEISNKTCKHAQENILTEVTFEKTMTNQEAGANNFCKSGALPFVHESSIHDEPKVRETHMESAQHLLKVDPIEGNIITTMRSKENPKKSIINMPHSMQHNTVNLTEPSEMDTHGTQNQYDGILKDTDAYRTADSESTEADMITKEDGNLKFSKDILINPSAVGQDTEGIENNKRSVQTDPMEKESLLQKAEDKKEDIYSTENETKSDEAIPNRISEVAGDFEATRYNNFCLEENYEISNKTCKHAQENILTEMTFEKITTNQEAGANNFCKSGALPFVHESSIHDEPKVRDSHMESAQHLLRVDLVEGNTTMRSKENPKKSMINMPHSMQHNTVNLTEPSGMDTHGTQNQNEGILKDTDAYRTADSESTEADMITKEDGNLKFSKDILINQSAVGQDTADFGMMIKTDYKKSPNSTKEVIQGKETTKEPHQAKGDTNSKSSTEILYNKDGKHKNTIGKVPVSNTPPVSEDVFDKDEIKRALVQKTHTENKTKKATRKSKKSKLLSPKTHPSEGTNVHCKNTLQDISTSVIEQSEDCSQTASLTIQDSSKNHRSRETASQLAVVDNVAQLCQPKIQLPQITRGSKLGVFGPESAPRFSRHNENLCVSNQESNLCVFEEEGKPGHVAKYINQGLFQQSPPSQAQIQSDNIQVLQSNKTQKQDIYNYENQQRREMVQPSAEHKINIIKEGFETITNKSNEAMNGEPGTSLSSGKVNKSQDHCVNRHLSNATNKQLANGNMKITRGLAFPINYQGADMVSHDHPQLEHLGATCKGLASATKDEIVEAFNPRSRNQHLINKSSTSCNFHKSIYKIPLRKQPHRTRGGTLLHYVPIERRKKARENRIRRLIHFNKSGWFSETSTNPHEEEMFCLKKISTIFRHKSSIWKYKHLKKSGYRGQGLCKVAKFNLNIGSFINISPRWVNKRFQRTLHKKFTRKLSYGNNLDLLHMFIRLNMGKKENRIRYLLQNVRYPLQNKTWFLIRYRILYLLLNIIHHLSIRNKSNCQIYQNSLRKNTFQSMSHQSIEMKETSVEDDSAMEVNQITEDIEFDMTASKGLPSSDEEMS